LKKRFVITIAGTAGSGKSTLSRELERLLRDATTLKFDDYFNFLSGWPKDIRKWLDEGANFQDWTNSQLVSDIKSLQKGHHIIYPITKETVHPCKFIFVEDPSGKEREEMVELVNYAIFIDIPNDIAFMRTIDRWLNKKVTREDGMEVKMREEAPGELIDQIVNFIKLYNEYFRDLYDTVSKIVIKNADLIIDGTKTTEKQAKQVLQFLIEKKVLKESEIEE